MLFAGAGVAVSGASLGAWVVTGKLPDYLAAIIRNSCPGETFAPNSIETFVSEYLARTDAGTLSKAKMLARASRIVGASGIEAVLGRHAGYAEFKRTLVTQFLLSSDYFLRSDASEPINCYGWSAVCANPFARFGDA